MIKIFNFLLLFALCSYQAHAQIFPAEGSKLCYRIIGFSFPQEPNTVKYSLQIARGEQMAESSFEKNIITTINGKNNRTIAEVPAFGSSYTWRTIAYNSNGASVKSLLHHFSVKMSPDVDPAVSRLRVIKKAEKYKGCYVFIDGNRTLYDMQGKPVWFLPGSDLKANQNAYPRDLKTTPQGSITFLTGDQPYEITYDGNILWHYMPGPGAKEIAPFHHDFTRLENGHYMGLIYEDLKGHVPPFVKDVVIQDAYDSAGYYKSNLYSSIVEYDEKMNVVWYWSGLNYVNNSDIRLRKTADFPFMDHDLHENSFYFDKKNKTVYLGFKCISRVIKISYPQGNVLNTYGIKYKPGVSPVENALFSMQHSCKRSAKGYLYLYNNNVFGTSHLPTVQMFEEPPAGGGDLKKVWEYECKIEDSSARGQKFYYGACVSELPDGSMFVFMGSPYPKLFIVNQEKNELWSAIPEKYNAGTKKWELFKLTYRSHIITRKELEALIWNSQKN